MNYRDLEERERMQREIETERELWTESLRGIHREI
jgi:hypothetical protein